MFSTRVLLWSRWLLAACVWVTILARTPTASAQALDAALAALASEDRERLESAIVELGALDDARALTVLQAFNAGQLRVASDGQVYVKSGALLLDAKTGNPATPQP